MHCILLVCLLAGHFVCSISAGNQYFRTHTRKRNLAGVVQGQNSDTKYLFHKAPRVKSPVGRMAALKKAPATFSINNKSSKSVRQQVKDFFSKVQFSFKSRGAKSGSSSALGVRAKTGGGLGICGCKWPDLSQGGTSEQLCPSPPIKCEICMGATNAIRFGSNPINYCGSDGDLYTEESDKRSFYEFCYVVGQEMEEMALDISGIITELTIKFGEGYGASHEI